MAGIVGLTEIQHQNGTSAMTVDASGRVLQPATPHFHVSKTDGEKCERCLKYFSNLKDNVCDRCQEVLCK